MSKPQTVIRQATLYDLIPLEMLLSYGIEESKGLLPDYDPLHFTHTAANMIASGLVFVAVEQEDKREKVVGCLALEARQWHWQPLAVLVESVHFYVLPEARGKYLSDGKTPIWQGLLGAGRALCDKTGALMRIEILHRLDASEAISKDELLKRGGLTYVGGNFIYVPAAPKEAAA